ncbi:MAG: tetratricopeptide repeat protein [Phycisphaerales bacterium]|nr:MAG: tetratricopeptide repeat protein [Phycisphaerales bacterium]
MSAGQTSSGALYLDVARAMTPGKQSIQNCPNCAAADAFDSVDASTRRCRACSFVFPQACDPPDTALQKDGERLAETVLDVWNTVQPERYSVIRMLGAGAQGKLVLARDTHLDQLCVVKILKPVDEAFSDIAVARLRNEAHAGVCVNHPNVARVFDCDSVKGTWYFVMEYVDGRNLREIIRSVGEFGWSQAVDIGLQAASGLAAIHAAELIHRDFKPSNLMLRSDGVVKIMDLGLVKIQSADVDPGVTRVGQLLGTPNYMAPEQFDSNRTPTPQADIYALGGVLYCLVAGRPPFEGTGVLDVAQKHKRAPVMWPAEVARRVPAWYRRVVETCLAKRPDHRFASAAAVGQALRAGEGHAGALHPVAGQSPEGVTLQTFRNVTGHPEDDWIGEAVVDCLTSRLIQVQGLHVADRMSFAKMLGSAAGDDSTGADTEQILEAARKVGAGTVVGGSFQRAGTDLRISAHLIAANREDVQHVATASGKAEDLFALEDRLADKLIEIIGRAQSPKRRCAAGGGTESLEAMEKFIRGRRAFADADYERAIDLANQSLAVDSAYIEPVSLIGACYARLGQYDRAVEHHQRQERLAREMDDQPRLAEALSNLGVMYYYKGEYSLAFEFLGRARQISCDLSLHTESAKILGNLGFTLMRLDRLDEAEDAFAEAIVISKECADLVSLQWPYNGMGTVLLKQERYTEAGEYYHRALALAEEIGDRVNVGVSQMNLGRCACLLSDFDGAKTRFDSALASLEGTGFWNGLTLVYEHMAEMYLQTRRLSEALASIDQRIDLARRHDNNRMEAQAWEQKARAYELMGQSNEAMRALKRSVEISQRPAPHDSLHVYLEEVCKRPAFR